MRNQTTRRHVTDYQHKLCRENLLRTRQQQTVAAKYQAAQRIGRGTIKHGRLTHL